MGEYSRGNSVVLGPWPRGSKKTDNEKMMNQLISMGVPDYSQERAVGNNRIMK